MDAIRDALTGYELLLAVILASVLALIVYGFAHLAEQRRLAARALQNNTQADIASLAGEREPLPLPDGWQRLIEHEHETREGVFVEAFLVSSPSCFVCRNTQANGQEWFDAVLLTTDGCCLTITTAPTGSVPVRHTGHELLVVAEGTSVSVILAHALGLKTIRDDLIDVEPAHYGAYAQLLRQSAEFTSSQATPGTLKTGPKQFATDRSKPMEPASDVLIV